MLKTIVRALLLYGLFALNSAPITAKTTKVISDQAGFDKLQQQLISLINSEERDIFITISPGIYVAKERHCTLNNIKAANTNIHILGNNAIIIPQGKEYRNGEQYKSDYSPQNSWMHDGQDLNIWSHIYYADGLVEVVNAPDKLCRLKSKEGLRDDLTITNSYILLTHWYQSSVYKILKIEEGYIYFTASDLKDGYKKGVNVNDDYNYAGTYPRYKLCNVETGEDYLRIIDGKIFLPSGIPSAREGLTDRIATISNCKFKSIEISGFKFHGNSNARNSSAFLVSDTSCDRFLISNCLFSGFRSNVITVTSSSNIIFNNNVFSDCYMHGIRSENGSYRTSIEGNSFISMGKRMNNSFCVVCKGEDFIIRNNSFSDFGYGGVGAGVWYKGEMPNKCSGIIQGNEMSYSKGYRHEIDNHTIMDSGAIYLWTKSNGIEVRNNYIHDISGLRSNLGIFCDDGAYNFQIIGNVITGIANSYCIGSRRVASLEKYDSSGKVQSNTNNIIKDNIVDGRIQFIGNELIENGCTLGDNYVLVTKGAKMPKHSITNVAQNGRIIPLDNTIIQPGRIGLSRKNYRLLKKNPEMQHSKDLFVRKR